MPKEVVTPEMVDMQLAALEDGEDFLDQFIADAGPELAEAPQPVSDPDELDHTCDCYERVHVEERPGRWIDKMVKRGGCCG